MDINIKRDVEDALRERRLSVYARTLADRRVEFIIEEHTRLKTRGKGGWHGKMVTFVLDADEAARLGAVLAAPA